MKMVLRESGLMIEDNIWKGLFGYCVWKLIEREGLGNEVKVVGWKMM